MSIRFLAAISGLKRTPRSGWITHGVSLPDVESVAEHTFSTCTLSLILADSELRSGAQLNMERVLRMAILHDLSEALTFDISKAYLTYLGKRGRKMKNMIEASAWKYLVDGMKPPKLSNDYLKVQQEYDEGQTVESEIVHAADSLDILLQVIDLRRRGYPQSCLQDLWDQSITTVRRSPIHSASAILRMIIRSSRELER